MRNFSLLQSGAVRLRLVLATTLAASAVLLTAISQAANPAAGSIGTATTAAVTWVGTATGTGAANGESSCTDGVNCDTYTLTVNGTPADWAAAGKRIEVTITPPASQDDYDLAIHKTSNAGATVSTSGNGPGVAEVGHISPATDGVGVFTVHVIYFANAPTDQYSAKAVLVPLTPAPPPPATADTGPKIGYENFEAPGVLTSTNQTTGPTMEYLGHNAGEPSIGVNKNSKSPNNVMGVTNFQSDLQTLFVTFANKCPTGGPTATWVNRPAPTSQVIDSDPIGFTDPITGRVFAAELSATSPSCKISYTDDDGATWVPSTGPLGSGIDHQTVGGGPFHAPLTSPPAPAYPNAVYYCSQDLVAAFCLRSDDGGATFGPVVQTYTTECGGLHGHVVVSPKDGTAYLPNKGCGGTAAAVVSEDNGITWKIRPVRNASSTTGSSASDPQVAVDKNGRVYFSHANADAAQVIATSDDRGSTWNNITTVGSEFGLKNVRYPKAVAEDKDRAAVAFLGSTTAGDANAGGFNGEWHMFIAHTFDGGASWTTSDATPTTPVQRGCIWTGGGANICRNLADFFGIASDKQGRVEVGYVNGCTGGNCAQATPTAKGNAYTARGIIARQSSGRRLIAANDPPNALTATAVPGMPWVNVRRIGPIARLGWSEGDAGNSPVTSYQILRGTTTDGETPLATVPASQSRYDDLTATDTSKTYFYKVVAVNAVGSSCANNEVNSPYGGDTCNGIVMHKNDPSHPESASANANPALAIDFVAVGEPMGASNLMFKMKVSNLTSVPANSRWRIVWDSFTSPGQQYYVGMTTAASGPPTFEYGTIATAVVGLVVGIPTETKVGTAAVASNFKPDGTITIFVPKSVLGNPKPGDLLGAVGGRTFTGDTPQSNTLERSTGLIDHTFVKAQTDNGFPAATYTIVGNQVDPFTFSEQDNVGLNTMITSAPVFLVDATTLIPISVSNGEYSINGGTFTNVPGQIASGDSLTLRHVSAASPNTATTTTVTVGCYSTILKSVTAQVPTSFSFIERDNVPVNSFVTSEAVTLSGLTGSAPISIDGGGQYSIDGAPFTNVAGSVSTGTKLVVRHVSAATQNTAKISTVTVGAYSTPFKSVTTTLDRVPDAFVFPGKSGLDPNVAVESADIILTGYTDPAPIVAGPGIQYSLDGGVTYTSANGTLAVGQKIRVKETTNSAHLGYTKNYIKVGGVIGYFTVRTK